MANVCDDCSMCAQIARLTAARVFGRRVREARERRGWSQETLAHRLTELEYPTDRTAVSKIEKGRRKNAGIEDVLAYAAALEIAPVHLIVPRDDEEDVGVTPQLVLPAPLARAWIRGVVTLPDGDPVSHFAGMPVAEQRALVRRALPPGGPDISSLVAALSGRPTEAAVDDAMDFLAAELERRGFKKEESSDG